MCGLEAAVLAFGLLDHNKIEQVECIWRKNSFSKEGVDLLKRLDCIMNKKTNDCQDCIKKYYFFSIFFLFILLTI